MLSHSFAAMIDGCADATCWWCMIFWTSWCNASASVVGLDVSPLMTFVAWRILDSISGTKFDFNNLGKHSTSSMASNSGSGGKIASKKKLFR